MRASVTVSFLSLLAAGSCRSAEPGAPQQNATDRSPSSGTVELPVTCSPEVEEDFQTAVALLHSFFYDEARRRFLDVAERDPECAMAWWGVAMTYYHPLWSPPTPEEMLEGQAAVRRAKEIGGETAIERGLIAAIDAFYRTEDEPEPASTIVQSCHGPRAHSARAAAFREGLQSLLDEHPDEPEVAAFHALALLGTAPPSDKTYATQIEAALILESLMERHPDHPGLPHYLIHAYDYPSLAERGLPAARIYDDIAPWVPHALHMPTHIYTRLGMWKESIEGNLASSAAAREYSAEYLDGVTTMDDLHALDYLMYAYLQTGQDAAAKGVYDEVMALEGFQSKGRFASAYAVGAIPARWVMEQRRWQEAASLPLPHHELLGDFPFAEAHIHFARALGAARSGRLDAAREAGKRLAWLRDQLTEPKFQWWIDQIEIQRVAAAGWIAHAEDNTADAVAHLRAAADLEGKAGAHPVTPGQILPAREQLADLLLELDRPDEALPEFELSLEAFPNRFRSHLGAGQAAERSGRTDLARTHYKKVLAMAGGGTRVELEAARAFLGR